MIFVYVIAWIIVGVFVNVAGIYLEFRLNGVHPRDNLEPTLRNYFGLFISVLIWPMTVMYILDEVVGFDRVLFKRKKNDVS